MNSILLVTGTGGFELSGDPYLPGSALLLVNFILLEVRDKENKAHYFA